MIGNLDDDVIAGIVAKFGPRVTRINLSSNGLRGLGNIERISPCLEKLNLSQNDLVDVRPLARLVTLTELNLAENCLADVSPLASLPLLQSLDLSGNKIATLLSLSALAPPHLLQLKCLSLEGNPVCGTLGYPHPVFSLFPSLETLDGLPRPVSPGVGGSVGGGALSPSSQSPHEQQQHQKQQQTQFQATLSPAAPSASSALREQLETMERAFEMQERALTSSGLDAARQMALARGTAGPEGLLLGDKIDEDDNDVKMQAEAFPYLKLLQLWRRKALESMTQLTLAQKKLQNTMTSLKEARARHGSEMKAQQLATLSYKEKSLASVEKASFWEAKVEEVEAKLSQELKYRAIIDRERLDGQYKLRGLRAFLERAKSQLEEEALGAMVRVDQAARKLKAFEARLLEASERVQFAAALVAQKEVMLRNTAAAVEAARRMRPAATTAATAAGMNAQEDSKPLLSDLVLRPEVESLLRTIFRRLDLDECGAVAAPELQTCLLLDGPPNDAAKTEAGAESWARNAGALVRGALAPSQWSRLRQGLLEMAPNASVTWGEFLLLLLPRTDDKLAALDAAELEELRNASLWGDADWGLVPLALPKDFSASLEGSAAAKPLSSEVQRLLAERKFLLERVQEMGRTLERRTEAVKGHFEHELRRARLKESHLQSQVTELRSALESAETRLSDAAEAHAAIHKASTERLSVVDKELTEARQVIAARKDQETQSLEATILEEKAKFSRLETEHNLLQREMGKKEIKCKGLQRDVMRLQAMQAQLAEEKAKRDAETTEQESEVEALKAAWAAEKLTWDAEKQDYEVRIAAALAASAAAAAAAPAAASPGQSEPSGDEFDSVRQQMQVLRTTLPASAEGEQLRKLVSAGGLGQTDVYAVHLNKLLRLAEEAISKTH